MLISFVEALLRVPASVHRNALRECATISPRYRPVRDKALWRIPGYVAGKGHTEAPSGQQVYSHFNKPGS